MRRVRASSKRLALLLAAAVAMVVGFVGVGASASAVTQSSASQSKQAVAAGSVKEVVRAGSTKSVAVNGLRLRSQPGYNGYIKGLLYRGDRVFIKVTFAHSYNPNWVGVVLKERSAGGLPRLTFGYVHKSYLR